MTILICTALLLQQGAQENAYDDYVHAAAMVDGAGETLKPPKDDKVLDWARVAVEKHGNALEWVAAGNRKPFAASALSVDREYPEFAGFRALGFLFEAKMFEQIADGKPNQAAQTLIDALTFGRRVQSIGYVGHIIGSQVIERNLLMWDLNRRAFAEEGLEKLAKLELIKSIPSDETAMQLELSGVEKLQKLDSLPSEEQVRVRARIAELRESIRVQFESEEADWKWGADDEWFEQLFGIETVLSTTWPRALVIRTKLRLLTATANVLLHEVRN